MSRHTVLYIEDNPLNRRLVNKMLKDHYTILQAPDGQSGIESAHEYKPDVILLDINLPDMHGYDVVTHLKEQAELKNIPVIALTANAMDGDRLNCLEAGCDGYLAKPVMRIELLNTIRRFLRNGNKAQVEAS
jgi:two-component system cell cycle response regulator DivK